MNIQTIFGHTYGMCYTNDESKFMYINISKNASTWTNSLFKRAFKYEARNWVTENFLKTSIIVLRDPVERWAAGMAEYLLREKILNTEKEFLRTYLEKFTWDEHTEKQTTFLPDLNNVESHFFYLDENYETVIKKFILKDMGRKSWWRADLSTLHTFKNESTQKGKRFDFKKVFTEFSKEPEVLKNLQEYYKIDYDLINSVKFHQ